MTTKTTKKKKIVIGTERFPITPQTQKKFIVRFYGDDIILFIRSFLKTVPLPIVNDQFVATDALINAIIRCWFNKNSEPGIVEGKSTQVLMVNNETTAVLNIFNVGLGENNTLAEIKKLMKKQRKSSSPKTSVGEMERIFSRLFNITTLVLRRCNIEIEGSIPTQQDVLLSNNMLEKFQEITTINSPF